MPRTVNCLAGLTLLTVVLSQRIVPAADVQLIRASVWNADNQPVGQAQVLIENVGNYSASDFGEFEFPLPEPSGKDPAIRFHVINWVVVDPCEFQNGRLIYLPGMGGIKILVYRRGDKRLLNEAKRRFPECVVIEMVSKFNPFPARSRRSMMRKQSLDENKWGEARVMPVGWQAAPRRESVASDPLGREEFLAKKSEELGFSREELASALTEWAKAPGDAYHSGLAALYEGRYAEAASLITKSIGSTESIAVSRYVALARAEYEQGHLEAAKSALERALALRPMDAIVRADIDIVAGGIAETKPQEKSSGNTALAQQPPNESPQAPPPGVPAIRVIEVVIFTAITVVLVYLLLHYTYKILARMLEREVGNLRDRTVEPATVEHFKFDARKAMVIASILYSLNQLFRSIGKHPPVEVDQMIQHVRESERPSAGMGA